MIRFALAVAALALSAPLAAQDAAPDALAAAQQAQATAAQMAEVQAATALAQMQFAAMNTGALDDSYQGAIAMPGAEDNSWLAIIVGKRGTGPDAPHVALAEYEIVDGAIISEIIHLPGNAPELDGNASAMAQARAFAPRAVLASRSAAFCTIGEADVVSFSTIVMPVREDGRFDAYVLNGPIENGAIPLGRHFKVSFDEFGLSGEPELLTDTCEVVTWDSAVSDHSGNAYVTDIRADRVPNEIHAFISGLLPMTLAVASGERVWPVTGGMIAEPVAPAATSD